MQVTFSGRPASQLPDEIAGLLRLFAEHGVRRYLEIGARDGDTWHLVGAAMPDPGMLVAVDLPGGKWGRSSSVSSLRAASLALNAMGHQTHMILGSSQDTGVMGLVRRYGAYEAILIDGDHRYDPVKADWTAYGDLAPIVAFHDIAGEGVRQRNSGDLVEVPQLWAEIRSSHATVEFVAPGSAMGIGVVFTQRQTA